jgi:hypothetical protein
MMPKRVVPGFATVFFILYSFQGVGAAEKILRFDPT